VNIFTTSGALPNEKQLFYAEAKYNSGIVIAREICGPFSRHYRASRASSVQKLHNILS
jgi:exodeoxyribonuclease-3